MDEGKGPSAGRLLDGRYELASQVGEGAAGTVWLARDRSLGITVAVKVLRSELARSSVAVAKFVREAELSARMMSPNIVRVLGRGVEADGTTYIAYELLEGEDLADRLDRVFRMSLADTEIMVVHVGRALARAHAVGVVHRDVKPENIYATTDTDGRALFKVLDFGVAELVATLQKAGADIAGTFEYMAPEVILEGRVPDARSDLYSLGVVAYRCLTGRVPYAGETMGDVMLALAKTTPPAVSALSTEGGPDLDEWFAQALARDPAHRFGNAKAMAEALHRAVKAVRPVVRYDDPPPPAMRGRMASFVFDAVELEALQYSSVKMDGDAPPASVRRPTGTAMPRAPSPTASTPRMPAPAPSSTPRLPPVPSGSSASHGAAAAPRPSASHPATPAPAPSSPDLPPMRPRSLSVIEIDATADDAKGDARRR